LARHGLGSAKCYDLLSDILNTSRPAKDDLHSGLAMIGADRRGIPCAWPEGTGAAVPTGENLAARSLSQVFALYRGVFQKNDSRIVGGPAV